MPAEWISAVEAAQRLGVKQASLYSYVSRGVLTRRKAEGSRVSLFSATEVEGLARRGRPRRAPGAAELVIETELTEITGDQLRYRGWDAIGLARERSFEEVAGLLWTGSLAEPGESWQATEAAVAAGSAAQAALPAGTLPLERLQVIVPALAAADPLRLHLDTPAVIAAGRCLIAGMADCLPTAQPRGAQPRVAQAAAAHQAAVRPEAPAARLPSGWCRGCARLTRDLAWSGPCGRPWSCSRIMSWPPRRWRRGWPPRCEPIRMPWSRPGWARSAVPCTVVPRSGPR